ncbi:DUF6177 family protein [Demequina sp. NBRC 110055]|uniref:DUF6177 family protein n=1 Tax=Demequina sp. NBRC 110055 TaxID=1570344 RepID=UPI0009FDF3CB|nr:DUF6177 family protein [Demequina sp. NBRC 110055]
MIGEVDLGHHPLVAAVTESMVVVDAPARVVYLSDALVDVLARAAEIGLRPVLRTRPGAEMTFAARYLVEVLGGAWVAAAPDGTVESPTTGHVWSAVADPVTPGPRESPVALRTLDAPPTLVAAFSVSVHHAADEATELGRTLEVLAAALADDAPAGWNTHEPALLPWDEDVLTRHARGRMPTSTRSVVVGREGRIEATIVARRTTTGVDETVVGLASVPGVTVMAGALEAITERADHALRRVADAARMPLMGAVSAVTGWPDLVQRPGRASPPTPVALLVGPRAARGLAKDIDQWSDRHRLSRAGRQRLPSLVATFEPSANGSWGQLAELLREVGVERLSAAAGVMSPEGAKEGNS